MGLIRRLRQTFSGRDDTFAEEMQFHLDRRIEDYVADGLSPDEARRKALRQFGNPASLREQTRDADSLRWLGDLATDIRYGLRTLARNPAFAVVAIATLALGIGANTAVFAAAYGVLLRPLPYDDPSRIVRRLETTRTPCRRYATTFSPTSRSRPGVPRARPWRAWAPHTARLHSHWPRRRRSRGRGRAGPGDFQHPAPHSGSGPLLPPRGGDSGAAPCRRPGATSYWRHHFSGATTPSASRSTRRSASCPRRRRAGRLLVS